jgi:uncharacterized protein (DUF934 family)
MLLLDRTGAKTDAYTRIGGPEELIDGPALAPFAAIDAIFAEQPDIRRLGAVIDNVVKAEALAPYFERLPLIVVVFPSGADGRGFSLARQLRRLGYKGVLRACGPLFSDQFPQALACGFDEVEIPDANAARQPVSQWLDALNRVTLSYQRDDAQRASILVARGVEGRS